MTILYKMTIDIIFGFTITKPNVSFSIHIEIDLPTYTLLTGFLRLPTTIPFIQ